MEREFWHQRWRNGQIGFHRNAAHWALEAHWLQLNVPADETVLVPLCGKSVDMHWLRRQAHPVVGVELDPTAVQAFFAEWPAAQAAGVSARRTHGLTEFDDLRLWNLDFFDFVPDKPFRAFYDRAALIALPAAMRARYMRHLRQCLEAGTIGLIISIEYDQNQKPGPPFSVHPEEMIQYPGWSLSVLERRDILPESPKFQARGVASLHETVYRAQAI